MPSLYDQESGNGIKFGDNARRTKPSTHFGTRQYHRWTVYTNEDIVTGWDQPNSIYSQLVRALQLNVELYAVYEPAPALFNCDWDYAFQIDVALDTSVDLWTATNSFISDGDPMDWYFGSDAGTDGGLFNNNTLILVDIIGRALDSIGANTDCWVNLTYTIGDMTWPIENGPPGNAPPGLVVNPTKERKGANLLPKAGESKDSRKSKLLAWLASLRG
jgi:hypothetical protein